MTFQRIYQSRGSPWSQGKGERKAEGETKRKKDPYLSPSGSRDGAGRSGNGRGGLSKSQIPGI